MDGNIAIGSDEIHSIAVGYTHDPELTKPRYISSRLCELLNTPPETQMSINQIDTEICRLSCWPANSLLKELFGDDICTMYGSERRNIIRGHILTPKGYYEEAANFIKNLYTYWNSEPPDYVVMEICEHSWWAHNYTSHEILQIIKHFKF